MERSPADSRHPDRLGAVLVALLKGVIYRDRDAALWSGLLQLQARARDYVAVIGLDLILDEAEGYAYIRQRPSDGDPPLPRLVARHPLGYGVSLLLALLRKKLAEFDAMSSEPRLVIGHETILDMVRVFLPETGNEAKLIDRLDTHINRTVELGFLRRLEGRDDQYEVRRILKTFVDAQWLQGLEERLAEYRRHAEIPTAGTTTSE